MHLCSRRAQVLLSVFRVCSRAQQRRILSQAALIKPGLRSRVRVLRNLTGGLGTSKAGRELSERGTYGARVHLS